MTKIAIIAGEASGDDLAEPLMQEIINQCPNVQFIGVGGVKMQKRGLNSLFDYHILHKIGLVEIIPHIWILRKLIQTTANFVNHEKPDILITIDAPGFTKRVARKIDKSILKCHIVAPTVWAWREKRRFAFAKIFDKLLCLYPFEPHFFADTTMDTDYIGHPLCDAIDITNNHPKNPNQILFLCGSRPSEIRYNAPKIRQVQDILYKNNPNYQFVSFSKPQLADAVRAQLHPATIIYTDESEKYAIFAQSTRALAVSGTACLELGLCNVPTIMTYTINPMSYRIFLFMVKIKHYSIVNILLNTIMQPEFIQNNTDPQKMASALQELSPITNVAQELRQCFANKHYAMEACKAIMAMINAKQPSKKDKK